MNEIIDHRKLLYCPKCLKRNLKPDYIYKTIFDKKGNKDVFLEQLKVFCLECQETFELNR